MDDLTWEYHSYRHWILVDSNGEVVAEVSGGHTGIYHYNGRQFKDSDSAKKAAMAEMSRSVG